MNFRLEWFLHFKYHVLVIKDFLILVKFKFKFLFFTSNSILHSWSMHGIANAITIIAPLTTTL